MILLLLVACNGEGKDEGITVRATASSAISTVVTMQWNTDTAGTSYVEFNCGGNTRATPVGTEATTNHRIVVAGLAPSSTCNLTGYTETDDGVLETESVTVDTGPAPSELPVIYQDSYVAGQATDGYILTTAVGGTAALMMVNTDGEYTWWVDAPDTQVTAQARLAQNGQDILYNIAAGDHSLDIGAVVRISLDKNTITETRTVLGHHDFVELDDETYAFIQADIRVDEATGYTVVGDAIVEVDLDGNELRTVWSSWDWLEVNVTPENDTEFYPQGLDWIHGNGLFVTDDAYYFSSHTQSAIYKIDRATGNVIWTMGGEENEFTLLEGEMFAKQHSPVWKDGHLMVFNNREETADPLYSSVIEYEVDESAMTMREVWRYDLDGTVFSYVLGSGNWLDNGNRLTCFGTGGIVQEVTEDQQPVWSFSSSLGTALGNAHMITAMGGQAAD